jgi:methylthioxylose transferase
MGRNPPTAAIAARLPGARAPRAAALAAAWAPLLAWALLIAVGWALGTTLNARGRDILLNAPPLYGHWDLRLDAGVAIPVVAAAAMAAAAPAARRSLGWRSLLLAVWAASLTWALSLALADGPGAITDPLEGPNEYLPAVALVDSPGELLTTFTERIGDYTTHVRSHPPGMLLGLWGLDSIGLGGSLAAAVVVLAVGASAMPAALIALRALAGEERARLAAPFMVVIPAAVWIATTADAMFMGVGAWAVALVVIAIAGAPGARSDACALAGGLCFGIVAFLSYGLVLLAVIPLAVAASRRRLRPLALAAAGAVAVALAFLAAGFWWLDGFFVVREQYLMSIARNRPYEVFVITNLSAFAIVVGPAVFIAIARLRDRAVWLLVGAALTAVAIANLSGMSKGEVERIWLPFVPWVLLAAAPLPRDPRATRVLLGGQAAVAIGVQVGVRTPW